MTFCRTHSCSFCGLCRLCLLRRRRRSHSSFRDLAASAMHGRDPPKPTSDNTTSAAARKLLKLRMIKSIDGNIYLFCLSPLLHTWSLSFEAGSGFSSQEFLKLAHRAIKTLQRHPRVQRTPVQGLLVAVRPHNHAATCVPKARKRIRAALLLGSSRSSSSAGGRMRGFCGASAGPWRRRRRRCRRRRFHRAGRWIHGTRTLLAPEDVLEQLVVAGGAARTARCCVRDRVRDRARDRVRDRVRVRVRARDGDGVGVRDGA